MNWGFMQIFIRRKVMKTRVILTRAFFGQICPIMGAYLRFWCIDQVNKSLIDLIFMQGNYSIKYSNIKLSTESRSEKGSWKSFPTQAICSQLRKVLKVIYTSSVLSWLTKCPPWRSIILAYGCSFSASFLP